MRQTGADEINVSQWGMKIDEHMHYVNESNFPETSHLKMQRFQTLAC